MAVVLTHLLELHVNQLQPAGIELVQVVAAHSLQVCPRGFRNLRAGQAARRNRRRRVLQLGNDPGRKEEVEKEPQLPKASQKPGGLFLATALTA